MRDYCLLLPLLACTLVGGCLESVFHLSRSSPLPKGLRSDEAAQRAATTASDIELWLYTYDPPRLKFYRDRDVVLVRDAEEYRNPEPHEREAFFFAQFNGVESKFRRVALPNIVAVEGDP